MIGYAYMQVCIATKVKWAQGSARHRHKLHILNPLVCKAKPEHIVDMEDSWVDRGEEENIADIKLHSTHYIISFEQDGIRYVLAHNLHMSRMAYILRKQQLDWTSWVWHLFLTGEHIGKNEPCILYLGSSLGKSDDLVEIISDMDVQATPKIPWLHYPGVLITSDTQGEISLMINIIMTLWSLITTHSKKDRYILLNQTVFLSYV